MRLTATNVNTIFVRIRGAGPRYDGASIRTGQHLVRDIKCFVSKADSMPKCGVIFDSAVGLQYSSRLLEITGPIAMRRGG
jgi:hypothetical protein